MNSFSNGKRVVVIRSFSARCYVSQAVSIYGIFAFSIQWRDAVQSLLIAYIRDTIIVIVADLRAMIGKL